MSPPGVNVVGYFNHVLGLAESAWKFVSSLAAAGVAHHLSAIEPVGVDAPAIPEGKVPWLRETSLPHETTVVWCNPDRYGLDVDPGALGARRLIGRWAWELPDLPAPWGAAAPPLDEVWVPSSFVAAAVRRSVDTPVRVIPPAVTAAPAAPLDRAGWGVEPAVPLFAFMFDYHSIEARKNPLGLFEAFELAFGMSGRAALFVKTINAASVPEAAARVDEAARSNPSIRIVDAVVTADERNRILAGCDCYVSLHRSEGFGITLAEAMAYARPVIATAFGGNLDFTDDDTAYLVRAAPCPVPDGTPVYANVSSWSDPDATHAAQLMRRIVEDPEAARERGRRAAARVRAELSPDVVGGLVRDALEPVSDTPRLTTSG